MVLLIRLTRLFIVFRVSIAHQHPTFKLYNTRKSLIHQVKNHSGCSPWRNTILISLSLSGGWDIRDEINNQNSAVENRKSSTLDLERGAVR